ncbi:MAG: heme o synthase [Phycisphaerales bacterium]|nr:heme o synthase [Phycisphaerales bacterium]
MKTDDDPSENTPTPSSDNESESRRQRSGLIPNIGELSKARLNMMVLGTTAVGFALADPDLPAMKLFWTLVGTALTAASAGMLNQLAEIRPDGLMKRTRERPLPAGLVSPRTVFVLGVLLTYAGATILGMLVNGISCMLALLNVLIYVLVYTPLKPRTTLNTLVGAICGAIPPMIGWVAATGRLDGGAWLLGTLLFVWQLPHFFALAMMYREDYERGGFAMLPVVDNRGEITVQVILVTSLCLIPIGLGATLIGLAGWFSALMALLLGIMMSLLALILYIKRTHVAARRVFLGSLAYLPLVLGAMVIDSGPIEVDDAPTFTEPMNPHGMIAP